MAKQKLAPTTYGIQAQKPSTRERIISSARMFFQHVGLNALIEHVAKSAETNVPTIVRLFGGMDQLAQQHAGAYRRVFGNPPVRNQSPKWQ